ncbi:MAG: radical SAM protein [Acidobacteria bacterium]|nr:radical SAM protein [Acidobacteriota bacterium]
MAENYPAIPSERDKWILDHRGSKSHLDPLRPYEFLWEEEAGANGHTIPTATIFLTNRECPFRCLMCDLWRNTLDSSVPGGAIAAQIRYALDRLPAARQIKLYNAGSFFDPQAIPPEDYDEIIKTVSTFERVIVECHPAFLRGEYGRRALRFQESLNGRLEIAIGLETVHPQALENLNKRMTVESFRQAARFLDHHDIDLRVFILLQPPFLTEQEGLIWACRSLDVAMECGAKTCSIIPVRSGNGAMEALAGAYRRPKLRSLEAALEYGLSLDKMFVFADLWDIEKFYDCDCSGSRAARLAEINRTQRIPLPIACRFCTEMR